MRKGWKARTGISGPRPEIIYSGEKGMGVGFGQITHTEHHTCLDVGDEGAQVGSLPSGECRIQRKCLPSLRADAPVAPDLGISQSNDQQHKMLGSNLKLPTYPLCQGDTKTSKPHLLHSPSVYKQGTSHHHEVGRTNPRAEDRAYTDCA